MEDQEQRLRVVEQSMAAFGEAVKGIQITLVDIKKQMDVFLDKAQISVALGSRVEHLEGETAQLFKKSDAATGVAEQQRQSLTELATDMEICRSKCATGWNAWWRERLGRFLDAGVLGVVLWLLLLWKKT